MKSERENAVAFGPSESHVAHAHINPNATRRQNSKMGNSFTEKKKLVAGVVPD